MSDAPLLLPLATSVANAKGWDSVTRAVMLAGKTLPVLQEGERIEDHAVAGCESPVWLMRTSDNTHAQFYAYSPSKIIRGVLAVLLERANTLSNAERVDFDFGAYMEACSLTRHLSQSRGNGIQGVITRLNLP